MVFVPLHADTQETLGTPFRLLHKKECKKQHKHLLNPSEEFLTALRAAWLACRAAELARTAHKQALAIRAREKALGPENPCLNNFLAWLYQGQGRYAEAESLYKQSLVIFEKALGPEHPDVAQSLNNLGELYRAQGKYSKAEPLYKRSLAIWEKALGPEHPNMAQGLENYAALLRKTNREAEATRMEARAKAIRAKHTRENPTK